MSLGSTPSTPENLNPVTRTARQALILQILDKQKVTSQVQLSELLLDEGRVDDDTVFVLARDPLTGKELGELLSGRTT